MALETELGTGSATAESYISVVDAGTYHAARGNAAWAALASDTVREQSLRRATDYMCQVYRSRWNGARVSATQALDWPRNYVFLEPVADIQPISLFEYSNMVPADSVPVAVQRATAELALRAASADLLSDLNQGVLSEQVGPIQVTYDKASPQRARYPAIDQMLAPYLKTGGGAMVSLVRA
jgi:hypothetical protein